MSDLPYQLPYQLIPGDARIPRLPEMEPTNGWIDAYQIDENFLQSPAFSTTYNGNWHANMQSSGQVDPTSVNYSRNDPPNMQPAGQVTEAFVDQSMYIPTNIQPAGQFTEAFVDHNPYIPTHMQPTGQSTLTSLDQSRNTPTNIQDIGHYTTSTTNQNRNVSTNIQPLGQHTQNPLEDGGNTTTNVAPDGQATPAPVRYSGNGNKNRQTTKKSPPASTQGRMKHPAIVEDKNIEKCAGEYNISYDEIRILKDYANARLKGIETSEPKDAPSRYVISRFEQVRRTYPEHATWPYDIPEEKIIRLLPGQKRQDRAPMKCYHSACETRRQELDARYHESRQWEDAPPPRPDQTHQNTLTAPGIGDIATGLTPPPSWNFNAAEAAETSTMMQHDTVDNITTSAASYDFQMDGFEVGVQLPLPQPITTPTQPDSMNTRNYLVDGRAASDDIHPAGSEEPAQSPLPTFTPNEQGSEDLLDDSNPPAVSDDSQFDYLFEELDQQASTLPTCKPMEQDNMNPLANSNLPAVSDDSQYDYLIEEPVHLMDSSELDKCFDELPQRLSPLPTFAPTKDISIDPLNNSTLPAVSNDSEIDDLFEQPLQLIDDSELDKYFDQPVQCSPKRRSDALLSEGKVPSQLDISPLSSTNSHCARSTMPGFPTPLPTPTPPEHGIHWPFHQDQPKEEHPFILPYLDYWPTFAPIVCHPLVRALELHTGRDDPSKYKQFKGYTIPIAHYNDRVKQTSATANSRSTPEAQFMPQGYEMTEELRREIEQRIGMHMKLRWGIDDDEDDLGKKARSGELVREDLRRLEDGDRKLDRKWRYQMRAFVDKWGLGGVQGSDLSDNYFFQTLLKRMSLGVDPIVEGS